MKQTLLEMTQDILSSMSADEVNSISDNPESLQVANIIKQKFYDLAVRVPLPENEMLMQLDPSLDNTKPVLMYVPDGVADIKWLKYFDSNITGSLTNSNFQHGLNTDISSSGISSAPPPGYLDVIIVPNREFIDMVSTFNPHDTGVASFIFQDQNSKPFTFYYRNDRQPQYCTIIKNYYVIFDSFDHTQDSTLQSNKSMFFGLINPVFEMQDNFIPDLADEQFPLLLNEAKALAFFELKQQPHQLALQETKRGWSNIQKNKAVANRPTPFNELPSYGRFGRGGYGVPRYFIQRGFDR